MSLSGALLVIGGFTLFLNLLKLAWRCWCGFRVFVLSKIWKTDLRAYGQWAVVTGATSGIGKAYAEELSKRGLDVVLISRSKEKLQSVATEIESRFGRKTITIQTDFTEGHNIYPGIAEGLQGLDIGILVNNVGILYQDQLAYFLDVPNSEQRITEVVNCNMLSVTQMTQLVLPGMVRRKTGLIINISSILGHLPQPLFSLYSATKCFVTCFSRCLHSEYKSQGISVQCVAPFMVSTNMTQHAPVSCIVKGAADFASEALNTVGHSSYTSGCISHALQNVALTILIPDWVRYSSFLLRKLEPAAKSWNRKDE